MNKFLFLFFSFLFLFGTFSAPAQTSLTAYFFYGEGCPHCAKERTSLDTIKANYPNLEIKSFEIYYNTGNASLLQKTAQALSVDIGGVPFLVIGDKYFIGYADNLTSGEIKNRIEECLSNGCPDSIAKILDVNIEEKKDITQETEKTPLATDTVEKQNQISSKEKIIDLPIFGNVNIYKFSLPVITIVLGFLDGFNPCAMWVLLFLVSLLFGMKNKKKLWLFGSVFLIASAIVYFLFMTAWLNLFIFIGFIFWMRLAIGGVALVSGYFNLKEYITNSSGGCKVTGGEKRQKVFESLRKIIQEKHLVIAILGLILLAFVVNLIELVCSLGLPAVYTQILALSNLSSWQYYLYLVFYVFIFILPAFIVFFISATTLQLTGISTKYGRICHLIGGIIMLIIGLLLIFKPQLLMFG